MNSIRYIAANLLFLSGIIHVARLGMADAPVMIVVSFGAAYLIIGCFLFRNNKAAYYFGAAVPLVGLCVGPLILKNPPVLFVALIGVMEIAVVVSCIYLISERRT